MAEPGVEIMTWDWREQPDMRELGRILRELTDGAVGLHVIDTQSDQYAIVLATRYLTATEAHQVWELWWNSDG